MTQLTEDPQPPVPRLRPGHLLDGDIEIGRLLHSGSQNNVYLANSEVGPLVVLEYDGSQGEPQPIPLQCEFLLPTFLTYQENGGRSYHIVTEMEGIPYLEAQPQCWEPHVTALFLNLIQGLERLTEANIKLDQIQLVDLYLIGPDVFFLICPETGASQADATQTLVHRFVRDLLFNRLVPKVTRNLDHPLRCLGFSDRLSQLLQDFLDGILTVRDLTDWLRADHSASQPRWDVDCATHTGMVRGHNEDACGWSGRVLQSSQGSVATRLLAVADGMGGHARGEVASHLALTRWFAIMESHLKNQLQQPQSPALKEVIGAAFDQIEDEMLTDPSLNGPSRPGTTLVAGLLVNRLLYLGHCGDSRAYLFNASGLQRLTRDHSLVQRYIDQGDLDETEAFGHRQGNIITSFLGIDRKMFRRDLGVWYLAPGDGLLLCCDGLTDLVPEDEILAILNTAGDVSQACKDLIDSANKRGGHDNISVVMVMDHPLAPSKTKQEQDHESQSTV